MRATTDALKNERREAILAAAGRLHESEEFEAISVARIAAEAAVSKGTVFVYFSSKEAVFLELALRAFEEWFVALKRSFSAFGAAPEAETMARTIASTLAGRRAMIRLAALSHAILERNVALEDALRFKRRILDALARLGAELGPVLPPLRQEKRLGFLLGLYGVILGATAVQELPAAVRKALAADGAYRGIDAVLDGLLVETLSAYIRGKAAASP